MVHGFKKGSLVLLKLLIFWASRSMAVLPYLQAKKYWQDKLKAFDRQDRNGAAWHLPQACSQPAIAIERGKAHYSVTLARALAWHNRQSFFVYCTLMPTDRSSQAASPPCVPVM
jgi:hypothetical protein